MNKFIAYGWRRDDAFDGFAPYDYLFEACIFASSLVEARAIAGQLAPIECNRFHIYWI